jgi:uncharacterized protein YuzE
MKAKLKLHYDKVGDILYISKCPPYPDQKSEELSDEVVARLNPVTGEVENLEILFFSARLSRDELPDLPIQSELKLAAQ